MSSSVIILGSNPATKLGLIRSIGMEVGCPITVINMVKELPKGNPFPADCASKYVTKHLFAQKYQTELLRDTLMSNCVERDGKPVILSVDDDSAYMIDTILDELSPYFHCAHIDHQSGQISRLMDKQVQKKLAVSCGFNVAKSWKINFNNGSFEVPIDMVYPCYVKGLLSYHTLKSFQGKCESEIELKEKLQAIAKKSSSPVLVEEFLTIDKDLGVIGFCDGRKCIAPAVVELLDSGHGFHKGVSAFGKVRRVRQNEDVLERTKKFIESISLFGLFNIDFVECNGELYFVELNLRFAAYGYAVAKAGVNLPALMVRRCWDIEENNQESLIAKDCYYINERVGLDDVIYGFRTFGDYKKLQKKADFGIMKDRLDPKPFNLYKKRLFFEYLKNIIKKILQR